LGEASVREFECGGRFPSQEKLLPIRQLSCAAGVVFFGQDSYCKPVVRLQEPAQFPVTNLSDREAGIICIRECTRSYLDRNAKVRGIFTAQTGLDHPCKAASVANTVEPAIAMIRSVADACDTAGDPN
jgi:hypothetical protein